MGDEGEADTDAESTTVLVVEDDESLADLYATWLSDYRVVTASTGEAGLEALDEEVDVVLLDRRLPGISGNDVLRAIREEGLPCHVAMVTAVDVDLDDVDMSFDEYLTKPLDREEMVATVKRLRERSRYNRDVQRYFALVSKRAALESSVDRAELEASEEYRELEREIVDLRDRMQSVIADMEHEDYLAVLRGLNRPTDS